MRSKFLTAIIDNSPESIVLIGKNHEVLAFNRTIKEVLLKYHNKELKEGDLYYPDFVVEDNQDLYLAAFKSAIAGKPFIVQNLTENENVSRWFEYRMLPVYDHKELIGVTLSAKDITTEKEAEIKIIELSRKFKAILDNTEDSITLLDTNYKILALNQVAEKTIQNNTQKGDFIGADFRNYIPDTENSFYQYYPKALEGEISSVEISYKNINNELIWYQTVFNPVYDTECKLMGVSIFAKDITNQKKLEQKLVESEKRFQKIISLAPVGIIITNKGFQINYANHCATDIFEFDEAEILNQNLIELIENFSIGNSNNNIKVDDLDTDIDTPLFIQEKFVGKSKNDKLIPVLLSSSAFFNKGDLFYIFTVEDISDINQKNLIIEKQTEKLRDLAWYQSHIFRAPLSSILGLCKLISLQHSDNVELNQKISYLLTSATQLDNIVREIVRASEAVSKNQI